MGIRMSVAAKSIERWFANVASGRNTNSIYDSIEVSWDQ